MAIGIGIGILLAPDKGSETRKKVADAANDLFDKFKDFLNISESEARRVPPEVTSCAYIMFLKSNEKLNKTWKNISVFRTVGNSKT